jgi:hypothetical protein
MSPVGRVLLISPSFFGYEHDIVRALERKGLSVDFIDERTSNSPFMKALFRIRSGALRRAVDRYYRQFAERGFTRNYQLVLVIKGEVVPRWFLERVKRDSPGAVFAFYTFDSVANSSNFVSLLDLFDHLFSFQAEATSLDARFRLKHLFYGPDFVPLGNAAPRKYVAAFIGTLHSERYRFVKRMTAGLGSTFTHFYVQARWFFALKRLTDARFREVSPSEVRFDKLNRSAVADVFRNSLVVLDMQHEDQTGLTMRSFEVIASGAYLVTTNPFIEETPLAQTGRVILLSPSPSVSDAREFAERVRALPIPSAAPDGFEQFALSAWVDEFVRLIPDAAIGGEPPS